jgi:hypothetical protein
MGVLLITGKVLLSVFLAGMLLSSIVKLSPAHRNSQISQKIEIGVGLFGLIIGLAGLYYLWV